MANFTLKALISFLLLTSASVSASKNSAFTVVTNNNKHNYNGRTQTVPGPASLGISSQVGTGTRTTSSSTSFLNVNSNSNNNDYGRNGSKTFVLKKPTGEVKYVMGSREKPQFRLGEFFKLSAVNGSSEVGDESASSSSSTTATIPKPPTSPSTTEVKETKKMSFFDELMGKGKEANEEDAVSSPVFAVSDPTPENTDDKFSMAQRIESIKTGVVGLLAGGLAITPFAALHDIVYPDDTIENSLAQWEFDTDTGSIAGALFAIVYRYCVREGEEKNEMLGMGVIGAFTIVRTLGRVRVGRYCDFAPLQCGEPLGYFDWDMLQQAFFSGLESAALFSLTAAAMDYCYKKGYISRFK